jgi:hypothetical protein
MLSEGRYTARQLARVIPEGVVMASTLLERVTETRVAEARAEGRTEEARSTCAKLTKVLHPTVAPRLVPLIEACSELARLRRWTERAPRLSDAEFASLVTGPRGTLPSHRRAPRPARKATRTARP